MSYLGGKGLEWGCCLVAELYLTLLTTPQTVAHKASLSMGFSRQEYWNGFPASPPGNLPNLGIKPDSPAVAGEFFITESPGWIKLEKLHSA